MSGNGIAPKKGFQLLQVFLQEAEKFANEGTEKEFVRLLKKRATHSIVSTFYS